jgi:hypothetical protein
MLITNQEIQNKINKWPLHWALGGNDHTGGLCQNSYELMCLCRFIIDNNIKTYTEVGIENGFLLKFMTEDMNLVGYGIDIIKKPTHSGLDVIYGSSNDPNVINLTKNTDLYFIDADHTYCSVKQDYLNYKHKCKWMAFHDILGLRNCEGVAKLWLEIKYDYPYWEFIDINLQQASGIGVIQLI